MRGRRAVRMFQVALFVFIVALIFAAGFGQAVLQLWNWLMPSVFGLHPITYWQALGLMGLCWILFGGPRWWRGGGPRWRYRMRERWEQMTPEEREKFRDGMRVGCGHFGSAAAEPKA